MPNHDDRGTQTWRAVSAQPGAVLLDGFHALKHALRFGADVPLALTTDLDAALRLAADLAPDVRDQLAAHLRQVTPDTLRALVPRPHPTGVAALARRPDAPPGASPLDRPRRAPLVVLDDPKHLGNIGAVVRLAAGSGASGVVTTGVTDPWHPTVVRAAAGLHFATAVERRTAATLPPGPVFALDPDGSDLRARTLPDDALLAFGSERHGLSAELRGRADHLVALPMRPQVSSYNLATSVAMALYHWMAGQAPGRG